MPTTSLSGMKIEVLRFQTHLMYHFRCLHFSVDCTRLIALCIVSKYDFHAFPFCISLVRVRITNNRDSSFSVVITFFMFWRKPTTLEFIESLLTMLWRDENGDAGNVTGKTSMASAWRAPIKVRHISIHRPKNANIFFFGTALCSFPDKYTGVRPCAAQFCKPMPKRRLSK